MSTLVERLRDPMQFTWDMRVEAADEIESLERLVRDLWKHISYPKFGDEDGFVIDFPEHRERIERLTNENTY